MTEEIESSGRVVEVFRDGPAEPEKTIVRVEDLPSEAILAHVEKLALGEPAYALRLVENEGFEAVPPELGIGLASERERWLRQGERARVWSPEDLGSFSGPLSHPNDEALRAPAKTLEHALRKAGSAEPAHGLNLCVARRLHDVLARPAPPKPDAFVVVVVGLDGGLRADELERYVPAVRLETLRSRGWS